MDNVKVDVVIPVYKPDSQLLNLLKAILEQTHSVSRVILINTEEEFFDNDKYLIGPNVEVHHISKEEFDHGSTRDMGISMSTAEYVLLMTMDAIPEDNKLVERLLNAFDNKDVRVGVAYARQIPKQNCRMSEKFSRFFNYPEQSMVKTEKDLESLGIKTYFCSDVCAMYKKSIYYRLGGFPTKIIFNEDMVFASKVIKEGMGVAYCSEAKVIHSHNYSLKELFSRNFDLGVSQADYPEVFSEIKSEAEGIKLVKKTAAYLVKNGHWYEVPYLLISSMVKYMGYRKGKKYTRLTKQKILKYTSNVHYWG